MAGFQEVLVHEHFQKIIRISNGSKHSLSYSSISRDFSPEHRYDLGTESGIAPSFASTGSSEPTSHLSPSKKVHFSIGI